MNDIEANTGLLIRAAQEGDTHEVQRLIPLSTPQEQHSQALLQAVRKQHVDCIKILIPVSNPKDYNDLFLEAVKVGYEPSIELLMVVADPKFNDSEALFWSTEMRNSDIIDMLIDVSDVNVVLRNLKKEYSADESWAWECLEEILEARQQKEVLTTAVEETQTVFQKRKM